MNKKYAVLGDIHLYHPKNKSSYIINNLENAFQTYINNGVKLIFLEGDVFDRLIDIDTRDFHEILVWIKHITELCSKHKIILRILEGTGSHDWRQSQLFQTLNINADIKYIDHVHIEYIKEYNMNVLYIPDEAHSKTEDTFKEVKKLLKENNLINVDIAIMHGQFTYQLPFISDKIPKHNEIDYLSIVKHFIHIGHVHQFSTYERIIAAGSFDRLTHGDEGVKGSIIVTIDNQDNYTYEFIINKNARIFKTIHIKQTDIESIYKYLDKIILKLPIDSYIRIKAKKGNIALTVFDTLKTRYCQYNLSKQNEDEKDTNTSSLIETDLLTATYHITRIDKENISSLLMDAVSKTNLLSSSEILRADNILKEIINA